MFQSIHFLWKMESPSYRKSKKLMKNPACYGECIAQVKQAMQDLGCQIIRKIIEGDNNMLEDSTRRQGNWVIKNRGKKNLLTTLGLSGVDSRFIKMWCWLLPWSIKRYKSHIWWWVDVHMNNNYFMEYKVNHNIRHFFRIRFCLKMGMIKLQFSWQMTHWIVF